MIFFWAEASGVSLAGWALARSTQFGSVFLTARTCRTAMARAMCAPCADRTRANGEVGVAPNRHVRTATQAKQQHATEKKPELKKKLNHKKGHDEKRSRRKGQRGVLLRSSRH